MEAILSTSVEYTYNQSEVKEVINNTIDKIKNFVKENNYQVSGKIQYIENQKLDKISKNQMKKIQKYCFWINKKPTLRRINTLFGILSQTFGIERIRIKVSVKEEKIQLARKEWKKSLVETERLLAEYKKEKDIFYKYLVK